ncbi:efflux RND transporter periplasmic adaptor subunit [Anaerotalea alkaliphila]|uniref:HlyD family efflux transporter periplasmic adaptor subunit n=1 Tax=Anaerotalea alkaliphila TaxID=2662126 RepID=A0A7X5KMK2_9FIRM|nr:efflux RND transporter periplasmic adaptor subunit [Anaerotalea alkaliphila]NDL67049.1 HlyD family efflux transporter periplasmic adaptor subunit [Anaerotalea alkaliphila]
MKKVAVAIVIIGSIALMVILNMMKDSGQGPGGFGFGFQKAQDVEARRVVKGTITSKIIVTGTVEAIEKKAVMAETSFRIDVVRVKEGDVVRKGDVLFVPDTASLEKELAGLERNLAAQSLQLEKLRSLQTSSSTTGLEIAVKLAEAALASAEKNHGKQAGELEKNQVLYDEGVIPLSELEAIKTRVEDAWEQVETARLNLERSKSELEKLRGTNHESTRSTGYDVEIQLKNIEGLEMSIENLKEGMADLASNAVAPIGGVVTDVFVGDGETAPLTTPLLRITNLEGLKVVADIREYDIKDVAVGQEVVITGDAIPADVSVRGKVSRISPVAVESMVNGRQVTAVAVELEVSEGQDQLKPGYTVDCEITTHAIEDAVMASYDVFREDKDNNKVVFVIGGEDIVEERVVKLGITADFDAQVREGLREGELVVVNPSLSLKAGDKVRITNGPLEEGE